MARAGGQTSGPKAGSQGPAARGHGAKARRQRPGDRGRGLRAKGRGVPDARGPEPGLGVRPQGQSSQGGGKENVAGGREAGPSG